MWLVVTIVAVVAAAAWLANDFRALWVPSGLAVLGAVLGFLTHSDSETHPVFSALLSLLAGAALMTVILIAVALRRRFTDNRHQGSWIER